MSTKRHCEDFLTKNKFYLIDDYIWDEGQDVSILGDDGLPCGLHPYFYERGWFQYYAKIKQ